MKLITIILLTLITVHLNGQTLFNKTYNKPDWDYADAVIERHDGKYLVAGSSRSQFGLDYDINLLLIDSLGNLIWDKYLGQIGSLEFAYSLIETTDTNYLISGRNGNYFPYLLMFDNDGNTIWEKIYPQGDLVDGAYSVGETKDSSFYFVESGPTTTFYNVDYAGDTNWTKKYDYANCHSVIQTIDHGYVLVGTTSISNDIMLIKTNSIGDTLWTKIFENEGYSDAYSTQQTPDSGYIIAGFYDDPLIFDEEEQTYLIKTNINGDTLWTKKYFLGTPNYIAKCQQNSGFIMSSNRYVWTGVLDPDYYYVLITKFDTSGNIQWSRQFDGYTYSIGNNVTQTSDGGFLLTGHTGNYPSVTDIILIKLDSIGDFVVSAKHFRNRKLPQVSVYPNPANEIITFKLGNIDKEIDELIIFDINGLTIKDLKNQIGKEIQIEIKNFPSGIYFYELISNSGKRNNGKFIVKK